MEESWLGHFVVLKGSNIEIVDDLKKHKRLAELCEVIETHSQFSDIFDDLSRGSRREGEDRDDERGSEKHIDQLRCDQLNARMLQERRSPLAFKDAVGFGLI